MIDLVEKMSELVSGDQWPRLVKFDAADNHISLSFEVVDSISWFAGHFPEQAVLPGVVQIHWAMKLAQAVFPDLLSEGRHFKTANNIKFKSMILPGQMIDVDLKYKESKHTVAFSYHTADDIFSTGSLVFAA